MRTYPFVAQVQISARFLREHPDPVRYAYERLDETLAELDARGPRGGRYRLFGQTDYTIGETDLDFMQNTKTLRARRMGRYVRPRR